VSGSDVEIRNVNNARSSHVLLIQVVLVTGAVVIQGPMKSIARVLINVVLQILPSKSTIYRVVTGRVIAYLLRQQLSTRRISKTHHEVLGNLNLATGAITQSTMNRAEEPINLRSLFKILFGLWIRKSNLICEGGNLLDVLLNRNILPGQSIVGSAD
jgi:hypothetical protein